MKRKDDQLPWLDELTAQVQLEAKKLAEMAPELDANLTREREILLQKRKGWSQSLADPDLQHEVRTALQSDFAAAESRRRVIEQALAESAARSDRAEFTIDSDDVLQRLHRLSEVLAADEATVANLELSKFIDRIECFPDGRVSMRSCKLGATPDAMKLLENFAKLEQETSAPTSKPRASSKNEPRRRTRLRVTEGEETDETDLEAAIEFAADTHRFAGLGDAWFWIDQFQVPAKRYWIDEHHQEVKERAAEIERAAGKKPTVAELARYFEVSEPTIRKALDMPVDGPERVATDRRRRGGYTLPLTPETKQDVVRRYETGEGEKDIAEALGISRGSVTKILNASDQQRGVTRPDGRQRRWQGKNSA